MAVAPIERSVFAHDGPVVIDMRSGFDHFSAHAPLAQLGAAAS